MRWPRRVCKKYSDREKKSLVESFFQKVLQKTTCEHKTEQWPVFGGQLVSWTGDFVISLRDTFHKKVNRVEPREYKLSSRCGWEFFYFRRSLWLKIALSLKSDTEVCNCFPLCRRCLRKQEQTTICHSEWNVSKFFVEIIYCSKWCKERKWKC